jgi:hypothetical protein
MLVGFEMTLEAKDQCELLASLARMRDLLVSANQLQWAQALNLSGKSVKNSSDFERSLIDLYGGAGSLNDVVLYINGVASLEANEEFNTLRTRVFDLCIKGI